MSAHRISAGTQVVVTTEARGTSAMPVHPRGAVGIARARLAATIRWRRRSIVMELFEAPTKDTRAALDDLLLRLRLGAG